MKNIFQFCMTLICVGVFFCAGACSSPKIEPDYDFKPTPEQRMTDQELKKLMHHARIFVSESPKLKLTDGQRRIIRTTNPQLTVKYFGPKYGQICMDWQIGKNQLLHLAGTGYMTESKFPWKVDIQTGSVSHPVPDGF